MTGESAPIVRRMLDALNDEGVEAALEWFAEDFEGVVPPDLSAEPDEYKGHAGVRRYFDSFREIVDDLVFDAEDLEEVGEGAVVAHGIITGRGRASGIPTELRVYMAMRLRDGKLVRMDAFADRDDAVAAARAG
jgi:ketosteroid isomerase-like protein